MVEKFILDATAGFRMMWFDKKHPNCIYLDQRPECEPDIVGDFRDLKQFADETFRLIVFDPPFWLKHGSTEQNNMGKNFGYLEPETWQVDLKQGIAELWRILRPFGILFGKWSTYQISAHEFLKLFPCRPLIYQVTAARQFLPRGHKKSYAAHVEEKVKTCWFCFMKIPKEAQP
jgi:hypothetical protein